MPKIIAALTGLPGSGKGYFSKVANECGYEILVCGDIVREEVIEHKLPLTRDNLKKAMLDLRKREGLSVVIKRLQKKLEATTKDKIIVEGVRSLEEVKELKRSSKVYIVAIHSSPLTRFKRLLKRGREDDPKTLFEFNSRDIEELSIGIGGVIALADKMIVNEGTINDFSRRIEIVLKDVQKDIEN